LSEQTFLTTSGPRTGRLATHGLDGVDRWLYGSMAETLSRKIRLPTLFVPATACGFVDQTTGKLHLSRVLVPVDQSPPPGTALGIIREFITLVSG